MAMHVSSLSLLSAGAVALLAGCAHCDYNHGHGHGSKGGTHTAVVSLDTNGNIKVEPELLYFSRAEGKVNVTWKLAPELRVASTVPNQPTLDIKVEGEVDGLLNAPTTKLELNAKRRLLAAPIISFKPVQTEIVNCRPSADGFEVTCENLNTKNQIGKYTVRVIHNGLVLERDPAVVNGDDRAR